MPLGVAQNSVSPQSGDLGIQHSAVVAQGHQSNTNQTPPDKGGREKATEDAAELVTVASDLRDQLHKMDVNVFSLGVEQKTEAIEKLVKKIKAEGNAR